MSIAECVLTPDQLDTSLQFDAHCPMMSLPAAFGTRLETIPDRVPYVTVPPSMVTVWRERLDEARLKVGIAWAGNRTLRDDARRSTRLAQFLPLFAQDGVRLVSLQKGAAADEWRELANEGADWIDACSDFLDTAALISALDLVISVDTAAAHLAGALGRPVWLLNRFGSEWRWGCEPTGAPWYPSMRIFNQQGQGDWSEVIDRIDSELGTLARGENAR
jgi:ADP-heptose:LPS heptosyltransferase